jgi:hypothetical protein
MTEFRIEFLAQMTRLQSIFIPLVRVGDLQGEIPDRRAPGNAIKNRFRGLWEVRRRLVMMNGNFAGNCFTLSEPGRIDITQSKTVILFLFVKRTFDLRITVIKFNP